MSIEIANKLLRLRKERGFSLETLAGKLGVSRQTVADWECDEASPNADNLIALAKIYGISIDELLTAPAANTDGNSRHEDRRKSFEAKARNAEDNALKAARKKWMIFPYYIIPCFLFIAVGFYAQNGWMYSWLFFLTIPLYYTGVLAVFQNNAFIFAFPVVVVLAYLILCLPVGNWLGMNFWHPYWIMLLTIPIYYWLVIIFRQKKWG